MSLIGYRNLTWLKARLLPADMGDSSDYDADLDNIGLQVAALFDRFTGRTLRRAAGVVFETAADQEEIVAGCYPIEEITAATLICAGEESDVLSQIETIRNASGIVTFYGAPGSRRDLLRLTITGGYWCDDDDTQPAGSTALPDDLLGAWVQQCRAVCEAENTFRAKGAEKPDKKTAALSLDTLELLPGVKKTLQLHLRFG